jgi:imidazolonepropionase-like amidohydrolase
MIRLNLFIAACALCLGAAAQADTVAIVGGKVHTIGPQGTLDNATIVIEDGRIIAVGTNVSVPDGAGTIDASGKIVTPGLFTPVGYLGLGEVGLSADPVDSVQRGEQFTASFDIADAYNPRSVQIAINRIEGITSSLIMPRPGWPDESGNLSHVISGLAAVVHLGGDGDKVARRSAALLVNLGADGSGLAGGSRAAALLTLRNALDEASAYKDARADYQREEFVFSARDLQALAGVLAKETPLLVNINRASDIEVLLRLVDEYDINAIINGGAEAWMVADEIAAAGVPVLLETTQNLPGNFDRINARRGAATVLAQADVKFSIAESEGHTHNARNITQFAGNAVADGLPWIDALRAITLTPAEIYGVADSVGSIEVGKRADIVIWPDDPLELTTYPDQVFIDGEAVPMISRQTLLRDRYLQSDSGKPPAFRDR